ncbi:SgcJ/EcaC family oxidoreductase [Micromonospora sp. NPDC047762]|uniref:SgcJ/EcaC family oxidoreductase n=1 Tax=Micromonospora sp. NPDC047762 TaxID=3364255 RepID=UPI003721EAC3
MTTSTFNAEAQAAVAAVPRHIVTAWAEHDADAFARTFTEDATMILPGVFCRGRDKIRGYMEQAFQGQLKGTRVTGTPVDARLIAPGVAVLTTEGGVLEPGTEDVSPARAIRASWILVERDGEWLLAAYQNSPRGES